MNCTGFIATWEHLIILSFLSEYEILRVSRNIKAYFGEMVSDEALLSAEQMPWDHLPSGADICCWVFH